MVGGKTPNLRCLRARSARKHLKFGVFPPWLSSYLLCNEKLFKNTAKKLKWYYFLERIQSILYLTIRINYAGYRNLVFRNTK
jgi:hypothetical protein